MNKPSHVIEIFLQPGEFYFGDRDTRIRTLLGSCVSITLWHPRLLIGGMCHFLLPSRGARKSAVLDGRYADEALEMFLKETRAAGTRPQEYQVKLFGGGNMFPGNRNGLDSKLSLFSAPLGDDCRSVSCKNAQAARTLVEQHGFVVTAQHLGGAGHRQILFDIWSGHVWVKHNPISPMPECMKEMAS
jgi:chemotaxis protein CheD